MLRDGTDAMRRRTILVPLVRTGGLGSCFSKQDPEAAPPRRLSYFLAKAHEFPPSMERPPSPKEVRMKFSPFDFDVVSGSPEPREAPKERPRPDGAHEPVEQAPPAGAEEPAAAK
jgi:hypothetical protein